MVLTHNLQNGRMRFCCSQHPSSCRSGPPSPWRPPGEADPSAGPPTPEPRPQSPWSEAGEQRLLEEEMMTAGILASLQDPERRVEGRVEGRVEVPKSSVSSLRQVMMMISDYWF